MTHDLIIIGGGPAGMAAALLASDLGLKTVLIDEQPRSGGQIYRNISRIPRQIEHLLGPDYTYGRKLASKLENARIDCRFGASVWDISHDLTVSAIEGNRGFQLRAPQLLLATGAMERASPIPGWTLPGVLNAGAAQIAMKSSSSVPSGRIVLAGGGPLLLLVACQLLDAGTSIVAIVETSPISNWLRALPHLPGALRAPKLLAKGLGMILRLKRERIPWYTSASALSIVGDDRVRGVRFSAGGREYAIEAESVLLHHGVVPNTQISRMLHLEHVWNEAQFAWQPQLDVFGQTSRAGVWIAGDGGGIAGALSAEASGEIAALGAAHSLARLSREDRDQLAKARRRTLCAQGRIRPFLDALYRPPEWVTAPAGDTLVCRCEEVTADQIAAMVQLGCLGPNQTKFFSRCGMGPCQGRLCGLTVTGILARERGVEPVEVGAYTVRSPLKPVPLGVIAQTQTL